MRENRHFLIYLLLYLDMHVWRLRFPPLNQLHPTLKWVKRLHLWTFWAEMTGGHKLNFQVIKSLESTEWGVNVVGWEFNICFFYLKTHWMDAIKLDTHICVPLEMNFANFWWFFTINQAKIFIFPALWFMNKQLHDIPTSLTSTLCFNVNYHC